MMTTHTQLSIVVPCYNEEQRIAHTISKLIPAVEKLNISYEIILVNDGSVDDTHTIIKDLAHKNSNIKVLSYHINKGKGYAVKCGIKKSQGEYYLIMDADLATDISELKKFWNKRTTADCLIGNRKNEHNKRNVVRDIAGGISHGLVNTVLNLKLKDTQCGFKLLSSKTKNMWSHVHSERRGFDFELLYLLQKNGYSIKEVDVKRNDIAGSKVTFSSYLTTWKELRNTSRLHNIKTLDRINQVAVSALAVMGIVFYGVVNVAQAQNETTTITECSSYNTLTYNGANIYPEQDGLCGDAAGQVTDEFPVGGLCRTGTPFLQNITTTTQESTISFDPGSKVDGTISIIKKGLEDRIIIAGDFIGYDKETRNGIAVIDLNGNLIRDFDPIAGFNGDITDIIPQSNGQIIVRGNFTDYNKTARNGIARLNPDGSLDEDFDPARYLNGVITAVNVDSEGFVFIGGKFTEYDKETANTLIKLNRDGSRDKDFNVGLGAAGLITSIAFGADGSVFVGGDFDTFDKLNKIDLVKLNKDGSIDTSFDAKILPKYISSVTYVLITDKGQVIVAGSLGETDEKGNTAIQQSSIVQLDPNGNEDTSFAVIKTNSKSTISFMTFQGSDVIFLGDFTDLNDKIVRRGVARVDAAGTILEFDPSSYTEGAIKSLSVQNPEKILIAGEFTRYDDKDGGKARNTAARIERDAMLEADIINTTVLIDGYTWSCIDVVSNSNGSATSYDSNGSATSYNSNGSATSYNSNGSATSYNSNGSATSYNSSISYCNSFDLINYDPTYISIYTNPLCGVAQGNISSGFPTANLCVNGAIPLLQQVQLGNLDNTFIANANEVVKTSFIQPDGKIIIGGNFSLINGQRQRDSIVRLNPDGSYDGSFSSSSYGGPLEYGGRIKSIIGQPDGKILIGGSFFSVNGIEKNSIARLNADGTLDTSFIFNDSTGRAKAIALQPDGKILVGIEFTFNSNGNRETRNKIIRLNSDGSLDNSFNAHGSDMATYYLSQLLGWDNMDIELQSDGKILVSGYWKNSIFRLNSDGSLDSSFVNNTNNFVNDIKLQPNGKVLIGGYFNTVNGTSKQLIARLNSDGSLDNSFNVGFTISQSIHTIALQSDGKIIIGGSFSDVNGQGGSNIVRLNSDGSRDTSLVAELTPYGNAKIYTIALQSDGGIIIGGSFGFVNGIQKNNIARLNANIGIEQYTWQCINNNGNYNSNGSATSYNSYGSATSYNSNGSATSYNSNGSATSYNSNGSATSYNSNGSATSYNSNGSATSYNSNVGRCGSASGGYFTTMPMNNLCDTTTNNTTVTVRDSLGQDGMYNWSCGIDHYTYTSTSCSAYRLSDGVCGSAAGGITSTFPAENLCASGTPYLQQVTSGSITLYTWSCIGMGTGAYISSCTAYQTPTTDACIPYGQSGTTQYNINNVILPGTNVALMLNYDYDEGDFANVAMSAVQTTGATLASAANVDYTDASTYTLNGIVNSSMSLQVSFTNLNTQGTRTGQFIQYRQPADISARTVRSSLRNRISGQAVLEQETIVGSNWYGCNPGGWRTSLAGLVPNQILNQVSAGNITNNSNGSVFGRFSSTPIGTSNTDQNDSITWLNPQQGDLSYQNEDGERVVFIAQLPGWINVNDEAERFLYWDQPGKGFKVECNLCATSTPVTTQTGACVDLPDHAIPNIATGIIQYTGANGWFPSTTYTYNPVTSTTDCTFVCENNYSRVDGECKPNTMISSCVGGMPQYAVLTVPGANTYTSTWNGSGWTPPIRTYTYNPTVYNDPALDACNYKCPTNYTWNGGACIANTNTATCNGTLPNNASWTNGNTFTQTRNGSNWAPAAITGTFSTGSITCGFTCNNGYSRSDTTQTCVQNNTLTYGRWTGDWSTCTTTGDVATGGANTYTRDIGTWGPCTPAVGSGTCDGYYPTAGSGGTCTNSATSNGFGAGCATMNITYNIGRGDGNGAGGSIGDIGGVTLYGNAQYCSTLTNPSACNAATSSNCRWFDPGGLGTTSTSLATCQQATTQTACVGENIYVPGNDFGGVPYSYTSGGIAGCSWTPSTYMQTCHDMDGNAFGEFACTFFRPGCTWNAAGSAGSAQYRPIVCRDQNGTIVADSLCPQPKPNAVQACTLNTPVNGVCGSSNGHSSSTAPSTNLCTNGTASTVSGNGPWSWTCNGIDGGTTASCSATVTTASTCTLDTTVGGGCFVADTLVAMADGSSKAIQDITVGDKLKAVNGTNTVLSLIRPTLGKQDIFSINGQKAFFTANHPFLTTDGWKSLDPETTKREIPDLEVSQLQIGDILITENDKVLIVSISSTSSASSTQLYNFELDGDHTYFANGYAVHNKLAPGSDDGQLGDSCVENNDCHTSVASKPPMACDNNTKTCKYTIPYAGFMCNMDSNGNLTNWDGPGCGDWATPNYVGEGCNQTLPEDGNLYTCQSNGNRSSAGISCAEELIDMENGYIPGNTVCTTTAPQDCICTANQYEPVCITALGG